MIGFQTLGVSKKINEIANSILARTVGNVERSSVFNNLIMMKQFPYIMKLLLILIFKGSKALRFTVTDGCIGCYRCKKICPVDNIEWVNGRPVFGNDCISCFACLQWCPESAIRIGKYSFDAIGMKHYHHPGVNPEDLFMDRTRE